MCVICHKPQGVEMPSDETIRLMFTQNPHGAGFAIQGDFNGKFKVKYWKGFMKVEDFLEAIHSHQNLKDYRVVMHFRIKTSGETDEYTTHPFKMSSQFQDLRKLSGQGDVLFHNGVFTGLGGKVNEKSSDTQDFVIGVAMHHLRQACDPSPLHQTIAEKVIGSCRVMILHQNRNYQFKKYGTWTTDTDGCEYSNMLWKPYPKTSSTYSGTYSGSLSYASKKKVATATLDVDEYGCNRAEFAWPNTEPGWINTATTKRYETVMHTATLLEDNQEEGYQIVTFHSTGNEKWYCYPSTLDIVSEKRLDDFTNYIWDVELLYQYGFTEDDEVIVFDNARDAAEFFYEGQQVGPFRYKVANKEWFFDSINLTAYTEKGIKSYFKTGEQGHIRRYLEEFGVTDKFLVDKNKTQYHLLGAHANPLDDEYDDDWDALIRAHEEEESELDKVYGLS